MKNDMLFLTILGLVLAVFAVSSSGCASSNTYRTSPVVTERVLNTSDDAVVAVGENPSEYYYKTVLCPSEGACNVEWKLTFSREAEVKLPAKKRGCLGAMAFAGLVGAFGGAGAAGIGFPDVVNVGEDRVDVLFSPEVKFGAVGAAVLATITGVACYATR